MDELHEQTVNLLSLQALPTSFFGNQVAFNMFAGPFLAAQPTLAQCESRILRHFRAIVQNAVPAPALLLVQAPVFHGYAIALFVQTASMFTVAGVASALNGPHVLLAKGNEEFPNNANIAGSAEIHVSIQADSARERGCWIFVAFDNLRVSAIQAVECAEEMVQTRPRGELQ